jgi:N utilization substance protein A
VRVTGALESFNLTPADANKIIMAARVKIGWIEAIPEEEAPAEDGEAVVEEEGTA